MPNGHVNDGSKNSDDHGQVEEQNSLWSSRPKIEKRNEAAAPPVWTIILPLIPLCLALYISSTRYSDFRHHGFDIISGASIGIIVAWLSFRWYHLPVSRGAGWAWGSRNPSRAFGIGVGVLGYINSDTERTSSKDLEAGIERNQMADHAVNTMSDREPTS